MPDMEKVIKSLEICSNELNVCGHMCDQCEYESDYHRHCHEILMGDALAMLKGQQERIETLESLRRIEQEGR